VTNIAHKVIIQQIGTSQVQSSTHSSEGCTTMELDSDRYSHVCQSVRSRAYHALVVGV